MKLFADYRQIHVRAPEAAGDLADAWTAKATDDRIAAAGDIVGTEAADDVDVTVEILDEEPAARAGHHITEASIVSPGTLQVLGCTDHVPDAKRYKVPAGTWRRRSTHTNLAKRERGLCGQRERRHEGAAPAPKREPAQRTTFDDAVRTATEGKRFKSKPAELASHCFALAVVFHVDEKIIARWDPAHPFMHFDEAAEAARALVRAEQPARAWEVLESRLSRWYPVDAAQELLTDLHLAPLMTPARLALVLTTPRAAG